MDTCETSRLFSLKHPQPQNIHLFHDFFKYYMSQPSTEIFNIARIGTAIRSVGNLPL